MTGSFKECYNNPCCKFNCMFKVGAECHIGDCYTTVPGLREEHSADQSRIYVIFQNTLMEQSLYASG